VGGRRQTFTNFSMPIPGIPSETFPQIAARLGITVPHVWDLATHNDEVASTLSIRQSQCLSLITGIRIEALIGCESKGDMTPIGPSDFCKIIRSHIESTRPGLAEFEVDVGWQVKEILADPDRLYDVAN
jgi:hypothetical protein